MSNQKQVKVISITGDGSFKSEFGNKETGLMYCFIYLLDNGAGTQEEFRVNHKTLEPPFKAGDTVLFEDKGLDKKGNRKAKLNKLDSGGGYSGGRGSSKQDLKGIKVGHAINNAVILLGTHGAPGEDLKKSIKEYAKMIYEISEELNNEL